MVGFGTLEADRPQRPRLSRVPLNIPIASMVIAFVPMKVERPAIPRLVRVPRPAARPIPLVAVDVVASLGTLPL